MKNFLKFLSVFAAAALIFSACQKELSFETGLAKGTLAKDAFGDCMPVLVNGDYKKDTTLKASNYVDVQVNITTAGVYDIRTDTVNGYSFRASGSVALTGLNTIRLLGTGKPLAGGTDVFRVKYDTSVCEINIFVSGTGGTTSVFTLNGSPSNCSGAVLAGTYTAGTATTSSNTATLNVNVTIVGTYSINTTTVNGVTFSGSGTFTSTGATTITLTASGTPTANGSFTYPIVQGSSNCALVVTYAAAGPSATYTISCTGATVSGTYQAGTALTGANTVTISATPTSAGSFSINTGAAVNGVTFSATGNFAAPGPAQNVMLTGSGTPAAAGTFTYTAAAATGGSTCTFTVTFTGTSSDFLRCDIDGVPTTFNSFLSGVRQSQGGADAVDIVGNLNSARTDSLELQFGKFGTITAPDTYDLNMLAAGKLVFVYYDIASGNEYAAETDITGGTTPAADNFTIVVQTISATRVTGTFSGKLKDATGAAKIITNGQFSVAL